MYVQIVTYNLNGVSEQDYIDIAHQVASQFDAMGGLQAKVWLRNPDSNSFGAVYFWDDREAQERFAASDLFEGTYPGFANVVSEGYEVYDQLTRATQPVLDIVEEEAGWAPPPPPPAELLEPDELVEEPELDEYEPEELEEELEAIEVEPVEDVLVEEPEPVVRVTRSRVVKRSPKKVARAAKSTKVIKVTKKAPAVRRAAAPRAATRPATTRAASTRAATTKAATPRAARVTKVTKVTKKVGKRPVKAQRAKKLR